MSGAYGIVATLTIKEGKMPDLLELAKGHFVRQLDGREPNATCATIIMPSPDAPNVIRFFEQWTDEASYKIHAEPNENLKKFFEAATPLLDGAPDILESPMIHYSK